ncbi:MAG: hypothetical protein ABI323_14300, partial [Solirubrobacteraceae bacterium]
GWVVLMKDARIRRRPAELEVLIAHQVRAFCLTNANLRGADQAQRLVENLNRILRVVETPGPYIYGVYAGSVERLWPR